jgi:protein-L-isoaspartate(D-aspartate) O-methyltransferase
MPPCEADLANQRMVDRLIAEGALWSPALIAAFRQTPRHRFLDRIYVYHHRHEGWREVVTRESGPQVLDLLYADRALITRLSPAGAGPQVPISSSSQPSLMAEMLEDLRPELGQRVLEIGAGTGYNAALLAHIAGAGQVHAVDVDRAVLAEAAEHLQSFAERGVLLHHGDGRAGWQEAAPFDRAMVTAASPDVEPAWLAQLKEGGVLVAPVVFAPGLAFIVRGTVWQGVFQGGLTRGAYFMPLRTEEESPHEETEALPQAVALKSRPAPWAGWFDRQRPRLASHSFLQAMVFYGWLRGLTVLYRGNPSGGACHGISMNDAVCWLGAEDWQVDGPAGQELAEALWLAWLRAGGPWPTEFRLRISTTDACLAPDRHTMVRSGPRCQQLWDLVEVRERPGWR